MFPKAELTPQYAKLLPPEMDEGLNGNTAATPAHQAGQPYVVYQPGSRGGGGGGFGVGVDINSAPFFLVQTKNEILITREGAGPGRHIFMDGRAHPDPSEFVLNGGGHSIGHYENGQLIVDTMDFAPGPTSFGRGYKGPHTHLTETFDLSSDGQHLTIHYLRQSFEADVVHERLFVDFRVVPLATRCPTNRSFRLSRNKSERAQRMASSWIKRLISGTVGVVAATTLFAQGRGGNRQPPKPVDLHDLSGYWELSFDSERIPPADLAPGVTKEVLATERKKTDKAIQWCNQPLPNGRFASP